MHIPRSSDERRQNSDSKKLSSAAAGSHNSGSLAFFHPTSGDGEEEEITSVNARFAVLLRFKDAQLERAFSRFLLPGVSIAYTSVMFTAATAVLLVLLADGVRGDVARIIMIIALVMTVLGGFTSIFLRHVQKHHPQHHDACTTISQAFAGGLPLCGMCLGVALQFESMANDCRDYYMYSNQQRAHADANCHRSFGADVLGSAGAALLLKVHRFRGIVLICAIGMLIMATGWLFFPAPKYPAISVGLNLVYVVAGFCFVCAVSYDHERAQQRQFLTHRRLEARLALLRSRRGDLLEFCRGLIPEALLAKTHAALGGMQNDDVSDAAVICLAEVHDMPRAGGQRLDIDIAVDVTKMQEFCSLTARELHLERVMALGDQVCVVGNLVTAGMDGAARTGALFATRVVHYPGDLHTAVHIGHATGRFVGSRWVRYEVCGPAMDVTRRLLPFAERGQVVASGSLVAALSSMPPSSEGLQWTTRSIDGVPEFGVDGIGGVHLVLDPHAPVDSPQSARLSPSDSIGASFVHSSREASSIREEDHSTPALLSLVAEEPSGMEYRATENAVAFETNKYLLERRFCVFRRFVDPAVEAEFAEYRLLELSARSRFVWLAYGAVLAVFFALMMIDYQPSPGQPYAAMLLALAIVAAGSVAVVPGLLGREGVRRHGLTVSVAGLMVPMLAVYGCSLSRPSAIGNDVRGLLALAALVQAYAFPNVMIEAVATPFLVAAASVQYALPGAAMRFVIRFYSVSLWAVMTDIVAERAQRVHFVEGKDVERLVPLLVEEERLRQGLLKSTLPDVVSTSLLAKGERPTSEHLAKLKTLNDTTVVLLQVLPSDTFVGVPRMEGAAFLMIESALKPYPQVSIVAVAGDQAMLVTPLMVSLLLKQTHREQALCDSVAAMMLLTSSATPIEGNATAGGGGSSPRFSAMIEFDTTVQHLRLGLFPRFAVFGVATRRLASLAATATVPAGVLLTDRAAHTLANTVAGTRWMITPLPDRWAVRGVGVIRMNRITAK